MRRNSKKSIVCLFLAATLLLMMAPMASATSNSSELMQVDIPAGVFTEPIPVPIKEVEPNDFLRDPKTKGDYYPNTYHDLNTRSYVAAINGIQSYAYTNSYFNTGQIIFSNGNNYVYFYAYVDKGTADFKITIYERKDVSAAYTSHIVPCANNGGSAWIIPFYNLPFSSCFYRIDVVNKQGGATKISDGSMEISMGQK